MNYRLVRRCARSSAARPCTLDRSNAGRLGFPPYCPVVPDQLATLGAALAGRYTIERELGRGGMATVYQAEDLKHRRKVAVKVLRPELCAVLGETGSSRRFALPPGSSTRTFCHSSTRERRTGSSTT